jgi:hypothetical protein
VLAKQVALTVLVAIIIGAWGRHRAASAGMARGAPDPAPRSGAA